MFAFLIVLLLIANAYLVWRIADQLPDIVFRLAEIQRDIAEVRRNTEQDGDRTDESDA